jgi:hypothetical protein
LAIFILSYVFLVDFPVRIVGDIAADLHQVEIALLPPVVRCDPSYVLKQSLSTELLVFEDSLCGL